MATNRHIQRDRLGRNAIRLLVGATAIALGGYAYGAATSAPNPSRRPAIQLAATTQSQPFSYGWPVKPFDRQHPVRGSFADPRSVFRGAPTMHGLMTSACACSFHQGIDISVPDGTAVYPVRSGTTRLVTSHWVEIDSDGGSAFQYWHITPLVRVGDRVTAQQTILGRTMKGMQHVHLTQLQDNRAVNPLAPGNIGPYLDTTVPRVKRITFLPSDTEAELLPEYLHGRIEIIADAFDTPAMPVPGIWANLPVTPARLTYRIETVATGRVVLPATTPIDVSRRLPETPDMWHSYARGTHMNMVKMGAHRYWYEPGVYLFKLTPSGFDTHRLKDGAYALIVTVSDAAGNRSSTRQIISIHNRATWLS
jgi:murein DD-endopeptidase MepM/ murein hydrolase activator NlpD